MLLTAKEFALSQKQRRYRKGAVYWKVSAPFFRHGFSTGDIFSSTQTLLRLSEDENSIACHSKRFPQWPCSQTKSSRKNSERRRSQHTFILLAWHRSNVWKTPYRDLKTVFSAKISTVAFQTGDTGSPRGIAFHCTGRTTFHLWNSRSLWRFWIG